MKIKITGGTIEIGERVLVAPVGRAGKKLVTVTGVVPQGDMVTVTGVEVGSGREITAQVFTFQPVDMEV